MNKKLKTEWIKALRSGEYKQARCALESKGAFCCLGVLAITAEKLGMVELVRENGALKGLDIIQTSDGQDKEFFSRQLARSTDDPKRLGCDIEGELEDLNDELRFSFKKIAEWVKKHVPEDEA